MSLNTVVRGRAVTAQSFDVIVIGAGPAGEVVADQGRSAVHPIATEQLERLERG